MGWKWARRWAMADGHRYTLRLRLHCGEMQRVMQRYYAMVDGAVEAFGGGLVEAPVSVVFEARDLGCELKHAGDGAV